MTTRVAEVKKRLANLIELKEQEEKSPTKSWHYINDLTISIENCKAQLSFLTYNNASYEVLNGADCI